MTRDERIEAVSLAIAGKDRELEDVARAAILATLQSLREPSDGMVFAGHDGYQGDHQHGLTDEQMRGAIESAIRAVIKEMTDD